MEPIPRVVFLASVGRDQPGLSVGHPVGRIGSKHAMTWGFAPPPKDGPLYEKVDDVSTVCT